MANNVLLEEAAVLPDELPVCLTQKSPNEGPRVKLVRGLHHIRPHVKLNDEFFQRVPVLNAYHCPVVHLRMKCIYLY